MLPVPGLGWIWGGLEAENPAISVCLQQQKSQIGARGFHPRPGRAAKAP